MRPPRQRTPVAVLPQGPTIPPLIDAVQVSGQVRQPPGQRRVEATPSIPNDLMFVIDQPSRKSLHTDILPFQTHTITSSHVSLNQTNTHAFRTPPFSYLPADMS